MQVMPKIPTEHVSDDIKRLILLFHFNPNWQVLTKFPSIRLCENPVISSQTVTYGQADQHNEPNGCIFVTLLRICQKPNFPNSVVQRHPNNK